MGGVCGIGSIKGRLSPIGSLQGALSIPVGGGLDCDIYEGEYNIVPSDTVQVLPTANKLLKHGSLQRKPRHCRTMDLPSLRMWFTANK